MSRATAALTIVIAAAAGVVHAQRRGAAPPNFDAFYNSGPTRSSAAALGFRGGQRKAHRREETRTNKSLKLFMTSFSVGRIFFAR